MGERFHVVWPLLHSLSAIGLVTSLRVSTVHIDADLSLLQRQIAVLHAGAYA